MISALYRIPLAAVIALTAISTAISSHASERLQDGQRAYEAICASCHESGEDDAPVTGNKEDWVDRSSLWEAVLFEHADKGYINMPARGDTDYATQYDVGAAAEYMLTVTHPELPRD